MYQQNQNYREPLTCTVVRIKDRRKVSFLLVCLKLKRILWEQGCHGQKWVDLNFVYTFERTKIKPVGTYGTHRFNEILSLRKLFRVCRSLQVVPATERCNNMYVAWSVMCQNGATRCQACAELFGYSLDPYVVHIPPRLQGNKRKKS